MTRRERDRPAWTGLWLSTRAGPRSTATAPRVADRGVEKTALRKRKLPTPPTAHTSTARRSSQGESATKRDRPISRWRRSSTGCGTSGINRAIPYFTAWRIWGLEYTMRATWPECSRKARRRRPAVDRAAHLQLGAQSRNEHVPGRAVFRGELSALGATDAARGDGTRQVVESCMGPRECGSGANPSVRVESEPGQSGTALVHPQRPPVEFRLCWTSTVRSAYPRLASMIFALSSSGPSAQDWAS
jgi:hypothetical protein